VTHPAPLVTPTGRRSWHYPVAAAAVIVLAVAVTWHVEREQPDSASLHDNVASLPAAPPPPQSVAPEAALPERKLEAPQAFRREAAPQQRRDAPSLPRAPEAAGKSDAAKGAEAAEPAKPAAAPPVAAGAARDSVAAQSAERAPASVMRAPAENRLAKVQEPPETWLERIAQLRKDGKNDEADKQLAEFRKRYPDYRIAPELLEKVEKK
jgi:hypothetical protein